MFVETDVIIPLDRVSANPNDLHCRLGSHCSPEYWPNQSPEICFDRGCCVRNYSSLYSSLVVQQPAVTISNIKEQIS